MNFCGLCHTCGTRLSQRGVRHGSVEHCSACGQDRRYFSHGYMRTRDAGHERCPALQMRDFEDKKKAKGVNHVAFEKATIQQLEHRYFYHKPFGTQAERYEQLRLACCDLAKLIVAKTPCYPEQTRALNALDEVMFLSNAAIARNETAPVEAPEEVPT